MNFRLLLSAAVTFSLSLSAWADGILVKDGQKIAFLGDSITANGWGQQGGYVRLVIDALGQEKINATPIPAGVGGNTSADMIARLNASVLSKQPDWMTLSCGVNDVWHGDKGVNLEDYKKNITSIVDQAQAKGIKVVILTSTPIGEEDNANNQKLAAYNDFLRGLAKERNLPLADLSADFQAALQPLQPTAKSRNFTVDGVHMNSNGNVIMAKGILKALGFTDDQLAAVEKAWLTQPNTATITVYPYDPRPDIGLSLGEFRGLAALAKERQTDLVTLARTLWLRSLAEAVQAHAQDALLDAETIKKEAGVILTRKVREAVKGA